MTFKVATSKTSLFLKRVDVVDIRGLTLISRLVVLRSKTRSIYVIYVMSSSEWYHCEDCL